METDCENMPDSKSTCVKSSAFAPVSLNLMGMYLVKEHMNAHYRRLYSVKAAVDTKAPHLVQTRRSCLKSTGATRSTSRSGSQLFLGKSQMLNISDSEDKLKLSDKIDRYLESVQKEKPKNPNEIVTKLKQHSSRTRQVQSYPFHRHINEDVNLSRKNYNFVNKVQRLMPQALLRKGSSRLTNSRLYQGPAYQHLCFHHGVHTEDSASVAKTRYLALTVGRANRIVPALNIKRDMDHVRWLETQAYKMRAAENSDEVATLRDKPPDDADFIPQHLNVKNKTKCLHCMSEHQMRLDFSKVKKQLEIKEEELKYLEFIHDVTNDILFQGIFSDRGLQHIFFYHVNKRPDLNAITMKKLLNKLQEEFGMSKDSDYCWLNLDEEPLQDGFIKNHHIAASNDVNMEKKCKDAVLISKAQTHNIMSTGDARILRSVGPLFSNHLNVEETSDEERETHNSEHGFEGTMEDSLIKSRLSDIPTRDLTGQLIAGSLYNMYEKAEKENDHAENDIMLSESKSFAVGKKNNVGGNNDKDGHQGPDKTDHNAVFTTISFTQDTFSPTVSEENEIILHNEERNAVLESKSENLDIDRKGIIDDTESDVTEEIQSKSNETVSGEYKPNVSDQAFEAYVDDFEESSADL